MDSASILKQAVIDYRNGNSDAFTILYEESGKYIYTCIYKVMQGNDNAQEIISDIMQDTYVEISKSIAQLESEDKFLSWAGKIATRKCYAYLKKNKKYVLLNEEDDTFENLSDNDDIIPEEVMQSREKQRLVRNIIETQLTEMQKLCIIAYYYNEQKQSEIAQELGIPENTVKTNLSRAKAKIKDGVLDLEKKEGTKLYSVAPFLLLLFKEDVQAATIPEELTQGVMSAISTTAGTATKGVIGKMTSSALKTKIIIGIATVGVIGGVAGIVHVATSTEADIDVATIENIENVESIKSTESVESTETPITEVMEVIETEKEVTYIEHIDWVEIEHPDRSNKSPIDTESLVENRTRCVLNKSIDVYDSTGVCIGYTKENIEAGTIDNNEEWTCIVLAENSLYVKTVEFEQALVSSESASGELITSTLEEVTTTQVDKTVYAITDTAYYLGSAKNTAFGINPDLKVTLTVGEAYQVIEETSTGWYQIIFKDVAQFGSTALEYKMIYVEKKCFSDTKD